MASGPENRPSSTGKRSLLWWRHEFYRSRWKQWYATWLELADVIPAHHIDSPAAVLASLTEANCDPEVVLRLAFLEASHKPATQSELAKDNQRQQRIKRKLTQSRDHLWKAMSALMHVTESKMATDSKGQHQIERRLRQYRKHLLKAALELEQALSNASLTFISRKDIDSLRALADTVKSENVDSLKTLVDMCNHEIEALLWSPAIELSSGHELFTLAVYVKACSGEPNFPLVTDLLAAVYQARGRRPPTRDAIEKQVQRFRKLHSFQGEQIEQSTAKLATSGELRSELLTCYPDQALR